MNFLGGKSQSIVFRRQGNYFLCISVVTQIFQVCFHVRMHFRVSSRVNYLFQLYQFMTSLDKKYPKMCIWISKVGKHFFHVFVVA